MNTRGLIDHAHVHRPRAGENRTEGWEAICDGQQAGMDGGDMSVLEISRTDDDNPDDQYTRVYAAVVPDAVTLYNSFGYIEENDRWYIIDQRVELVPFE